MAGGGDLSPNQHALRPGEPRDQAYPEFEKATLGEFPATPQHSAQGYLDYVSGLFVRSESFTPVGTADRPTGECIACKSARAPRSFPLSYVISPLNETDTSPDLYRGSFYKAKASGKRPRAYRILIDVHRRYILAKYATN